MGTAQRHIKGHVTTCPSPLRYQPSTEVSLHSSEILLCRTLPSAISIRWLGTFNIHRNFLLTHDLIHSSSIQKLAPSIIWKPGRAIHEINATTKTQTATPIPPLGIKNSRL